MFLISARARAITACLAAMLLQSVPPAAYCQATVKAVKLNQSQYFIGPNVLYIARDAVRLENKGPLKFILVSRAPDWKVTIYRLDDKTFFTESLPEFEETGLISDFLVGRRDRWLSRILHHRRSTMAFCGFNVIRLTHPQETFKYLPLSEVENAVPQVERVVHGAYKMPSQGGIPISYIGVHSGKDFMAGQVNEAGARQVYFETGKIETVSVPSSIFNLPAGYHKAKSIREVVSGNSTRAESEGFIESLGSQRMGKSGR